MPVIEYECECGSCDGTGLYVGMGERDGAAIVCSNCKGSGKRHIVLRYTTFTGLKPRSDVKQVYEWNPGIILSDRHDFGGMSYIEWLEGKPFPPKSEMRQFTCPAWWYQGADGSKDPDWEECKGAGQFSRCKHFCNKDKCWDRWDKEQEGKE